VGGEVVEWAIGEVANRIKATRDATFIEKNPQGVPVNRTEAIAWPGGAANNTTKTVTWRPS
jgi:formate dehydrogenase major subunit